MTFAIREYRKLSKEEKVLYDPTGKKGADHVRLIKFIARFLATVKAGEKFYIERKEAEFAKSYLHRLESGYAALMVPELEREIQNKFHIIPLGENDAALVNKMAHMENPLKRNWLSPKASMTRPPNKGIGIVASIINYKGKHKGRIGYEYIPVARSCARISRDGSIMTAYCISLYYTLHAGRGFRWEPSDLGGVRLVRNSDGADYHPDSDDIAAGRDVIVAKLRENAAKRKAERKAAQREKKIIKEASRYGTWVSFTDALHAGNCHAGVYSYVRSNGLDPNRHYKIDALPVKSEYERQRIALIALVALRRQATDLKRGYSELPERKR